MFKQWYDTVGIIGGNLFVVCVLLVVAYIVIEVIFVGRTKDNDIEEAELEYQERKRPRPYSVSKDSDEKDFFDKVEEARNDFN